jgi:hypothetical protein
MLSAFKLLAINVLWVDACGKWQQALTVIFL